jgi:3-deoxy-manno-octulosonate cytidylyltransferase (CMP-KDO synthetase)
MIQRVVDAACRSAADEVLVATDDERIAAAALDPRAPARSLALMTRADHMSGTDRIAEVAQTRGWDGRTIVVNVQGDEPQLPPQLIDQVAALLDRHVDADLATLCTPIGSVHEFLDPNVVKVVTGRGIATVRRTDSRVRRAFSARNGTWESTRTASRRCAG